MVTRIDIPALALRRNPTTKAAIVYAMRIHDGQRRKVDGAPFILHPLEVASLLHDAGAPDHVVAAGLLHDTVEKCHAAVSDLRRRFGGRVTRLVLAVSEDERIERYDARKAALREQVAVAGDEALMLFAADKLSKVREMNLEHAGAQQGYRSRLSLPSRTRRLAHYRRCLRLLEQNLPGSSLVVELRAELEALDEHQPTAS